MTQSRDISDDQILGELEAHGRSWQDYFLLGTPPAICSGGKDGIAVLTIEDDELAKAAVSLLTRRGAPHFKDIAEVKAAASWDGLARPARAD